MNIVNARVCMVWVGLAAFPASGRALLTAESALGLIYLLAQSSNETVRQQFGPRAAITVIKIYYEYSCQLRNFKRGFTILSEDNIVRLYRALPRPPEDVLTVPWQPWARPGQRETSFTVYLNCGLKLLLRFISPKHTDLSEVMSCIDCYSSK